MIRLHFKKKMIKIKQLNHNTMKDIPKSLTTPHAIIKTIGKITIGSQSIKFAHIKKIKMLKIFIFF